MSILTEIIKHAESAPVIVNGEVRSYRLTLSPAGLGALKQFDTKHQVEQLLITDAPGFDHIRAIMESHPRTGGRHLGHFTVVYKEKAWSRYFGWMKCPMPEHIAKCDMAELMERLPNDEQLIRLIEVIKVALQKEVSAK